MALKKSRANGPSIAVKLYKFLVLNVLIAESLFKSISDIFPAFPAGKTSFMICSSNRLPSLLTDSRNCHPATNLFDLQWKAYSHCQHSSGKPISAISWLAYRYQLFAVDAPH
jgi:hypothetical protein